MTRLSNFAIAAVLYAFVLGFSLPSATAGLWVEMKLNEVFPGKPMPEGTAPWAIARFEDTATNEVTLTLKTFLAGSNKIQGSAGQLGWSFNIVEEKESLLGSLEISFIGSSTGAPAGDWIIEADSHNANGVGGAFDIMFYWPNKKGGPLTGNQELQYKLTGIPGLSALDFDAKSESKTHGDTIYKTAAKLQGVGPKGDDSTYIGASLSQVAPEPQTCVMWSLLAAIMGGVLYRRRLQAA